MSKVMGLAEAVGMIPDSAVLAIGGNTFHRAPGATLHELVRQGKRNLTVVKTAGAYDVDLLAGAGLMSRAVAAYVGFETLGLAPRFRKGAETGQIAVQEHT